MGLNLQIKQHATGHGVSAKVKASSKQKWEGEGNQNLTLSLKPVVADASMPSAQAK